MLTKILNKLAHVMKSLAERNSMQYAGFEVASLLRQTLWPDTAAGHLSSKYQCSRVNPHELLQLHGDS